MARDRASLPELEDPFLASVLKVIRDRNMLVDASYEKLHRWIAESERIRREADARQK